MDRKQDHNEQDAQQRQRERDNRQRDDDRRWADEAAKARTADDPRARTPRDAAGQPTTRSFDE